MQKNLTPLNRLLVVHFLIESQFWFPIWFIFLEDKGFAIGLIVLADMFFRVVMVLLEVPLGIVGDWLGRKRTYLLTIGFGIGTYVLNILIGNTAMLLIAWACWGIFRALASGTDIAYRYEIIVFSNEQDRTTQILGRFQSLTAAALLISHLTAGWMYEVNPNLPFAVNGVFAVLALVLAFGLPANTEPDPLISANPLIQNSPRTILRILRGNRVVLVGILLMAVIMMYFWTPTLLFQPLLTELGLSPGLFGVVFVVFSGVGIVASLVTHRISERMGEVQTVVMSVAILLAATAVTGFGPGLAALSGIILLSVGFYFSIPVMETIVNRELDDLNRATIFSVGSLLSSLLMIGSRPALGLITRDTSVSAALQVWTVVGVVVLGLVVWGAWLIARTSSRVTRVDEGGA